MEFGITDIVSGFLHRYAVCIMDSKPFEKAPELDIYLTLFIVMRHLKAVGTFAFLEHAYDAQKMRKDRGLLDTCSSDRQSNT